MQSPERGPNSHCRYRKAPEYDPIAQTHTVRTSCHPEQHKEHIPNPTSNELYSIGTTTTSLTTPSCFSKCLIIARKIIFAIIGGTALPICFLIAFPWKTWCRGNDCKAAISLSVKSRLPLGWPLFPPSVVIQVVIPESSQEINLFFRRFSAAWMSWFAAFRGIFERTFLTLL